MAEPALTLTYRCTIDGLISLGTWSKIEQLGFTYEVTEYREGGVNSHIHKLVGPVKYDNVRLSRPIDQSSMKVAAWLAANLVKIVGQTMSIAALDSAGDWTRGSHSRSTIVAESVLGQYFSFWSSPSNSCVVSCPLLSSPLTVTRAGSTPPNVAISMAQRGALVTGMPLRISTALGSRAPR